MNEAWVRLEVAVQDERIDRDLLRFERAYRFASVISTYIMIAYNLL